MAFVFVFSIRSPDPDLPCTVCVLLYRNTQLSLEEKICFPLLIKKNILIRYWAAWGPLMLISSSSSIIHNLIFGIGNYELI